MVNEVTPFVGVWIEIKNTKNNKGKGVVTPFVGVWIEMSKYLKLLAILIRHSLRGSVD